MANVVVGDTIRVVAKMRDKYSSIIENRFFWRHIGTNPVSDATVLTDIENGLSTTYGWIDGWMPDSLNPVQLVVDVVYFIAGKLHTQREVGTAAWVTWGGGDSAGESMAPQLAIQLNFPTVVPRTMGRKYMGPLVEGANGDGEIQAGAILSALTFGADFLGTWNIGGEDFIPGIMSKHTLDLVPFTSVVCPAAYATHRSRKQGVGS